MNEFAHLDRENMVLHIYDYWKLQDAKEKMDCHSPESVTQKVIYPLTAFAESVGECYCTLQSILDKRIVYHFNDLKYKLITIEQYGFVGPIKENGYFVVFKDESLPELGNERLVSQSELLEYLSHNTVIDEPNRTIMIDTITKLGTNHMYALQLKSTFFHGNYYAVKIFQPL
jgi:hypothetical protein